jgi:heptosyltransferase-2
VKNLLFIKLGAIGDVVMAMSAARHVIRTDQSRITWLAGAQVVPLIRRVLPEIELIAVDEVRLLKSGTLTSMLELARVNRMLAFRRFDRLASGYRDPRYRLLALSCHSRSIIREFVPEPGRYHAEAYYELLSGNRLEPAEAPIHPSMLIASASSNGKGIVLAPGGAKNLLRDDALRRYPIFSYVRLARLALDSGKPVTIMGANSDGWIRPYFEGLPIRFELGTLPLEEVPFWLQQFERLITHDSGPMHLGFMSGIPVTALFGPTRADEKVPRNFGFNGSIVVQGGRSLPCAPCYDGKNYAPCTHQSCLAGLNASEEWLGGTLRFAHPLDQC